MTTVNNNKNNKVDVSLVTSCITTSNNDGNLNTIKKKVSNNEDIALFGSLNEVIGTKFYDCIEYEIANCISTLPALSTITNGELQLVTYLKTIYDKYIDLFMLYCQRNIFTIQHIFPKNATKKRHLISQIYHDPSFDPYNVSNDENTHKEKGDSNYVPLQEVSDGNNLDRTNDNDGPIGDFAVINYNETIKDAPERVKTIQHDIMKLRKQLKEKKRQKIEILKSVEQLNVTNEFIKDVEQATELAIHDDNNNNDDKSSSTTTVLDDMYSVQHKRIMEIFKSCENLQQLQSYGQQLQERMIELRNREHGITTWSNDDELELYDPSFLGRNNDMTTNDLDMNLSFQARYEQDKNMFQDLGLVKRWLTEPTANIKSKK